MTVRTKSCITCNKKLAINNKSGYCFVCYRKSPNFLEYQKLYQRKYIKTDKYKEYRTDYIIKNYDKLKEYQKKYRQVPEHRDKMRIQKREYAKRKMMKGGK